MTMARLHHLSPSRGIMQVIECGVWTVEQASPIGMAFELRAFLLPPFSSSSRRLVDITLQLSRFPILAHAFHVAGDWMDVSLSVHGIHKRRRQGHDWFSLGLLGRDLVARVPKHSSSRLSPCVRAGTCRWSAGSLQVVCRLFLQVSCIDQ